MGVGHASIAVAATRLAPNVNAGWLVFAAFVADFLLGIFAALGFERVHVPPDYAAKHYLTFTFPYSHGLVPLLIWGAILGWLISRFHAPARQRVLLVVGALVVSHFILDGIVHVAGLPILGESSPKLGLGLWRNMPLELALETAVTLACIVIYLRLIGGGAPLASRYGVPGLLLLLTALTWSPLASTVPPSPAELIPGWIGMPPVLSALVYLLDRGRFS